MPHPSDALNRAVPRGFRAATACMLRVAMEGLILLLVCLTPWAFGCVHPSFEFLLDAGLALLFVMWAIHLGLTGTRSWEFSPVAMCLAGLLVLGLWQLAPLSGPTLRWISPGTATWYARLLPPTPEVLPEVGPVDGPTRAGSTISLDPGATRAEVIRLLAVLALFILVRQNLASPAALRRLSLVAVTNGTLLVLFALVQYWTTRLPLLYWTFPTVGWAFGPFINHNHAACYFNLCFGLGLGLFLSRARSAEALVGRAWWLDAGILWLLLPLTILLVGIAFSLSRGGLFAFFGASGFCLSLRFALGMRGPLIGTLLAVVGLALVLLSWFGMGPLMDRVNTAWEHGDPSRVRVWARVLPLAQDFPLWGTGYGTFEAVELTQRADVIDFGFVFSHAHNEYVEALVEGGIPRLLLTLGVIGLIGLAALRVMRAAPTSLAADLALGGLFAIVTLALQSVVEFGVHTPAIALLATVVAAQLSGMDAATRISAGNTTPAGRLARSVAALVALGVAFILGAEGWKVYRVDLLQSSAQPGAGGVLAPEQILRLEKAARLAPDNAPLHLDLARAHLRVVEEQKKQLVRRLLVREAAQAVLTFAPPGDVAQASHPALTCLPGLLVIVQERGPILQADADRFGPSLTAALGHLIQARNANPLLADAHLQLAAHTHEFISPDSSVAYLDRAKLLAPGDPHVWYLCGLRDLALLQPHRACSDWRHCLELSNEHLSDILKASAPLFPPRVIRTQILAENPHQLLFAAFQLFPAAEQEPERRPFLEQALTLLEGRPAAARTAEELHVEAVILASCNHVERALTAYQLALGQQPQRVDWRWEFAKLLHQQARLPEARLELRSILRDQPSHAPARELWRIVEREIAERR